MSQGSRSLEKVAGYLARLPGIGEKTAMRLALYLLRTDGSFAHEFGQSLLELKEKVQLCPTCCCLIEDQKCVYCADPHRSDKVICVVEDISDLVAIEHAQPGTWSYHVLHGVLSPLDGITPNELKIRELLGRLEKSKAEEVILATNASVEGEATSLYLAKLLAPLNVKVTRIAQGIPMGSQLEYIDQATLGRALNERQTVQQPQTKDAHVSDQPF